MQPSEQERFRRAAGDAAAGNATVEQFILRIAQVESRLGADTDGLTRNKASRGFTQIDRVLFEDLRQRQDIKDRGIEHFDDLNDPEKAAHATRIALRRNPLAIPADAAAQAAYWKVFWNTDAQGAKGTVERFLRDAVGLGGDELRRQTARAKHAAAIYRRAKRDGLLFGDADARDAAVNALRAGRFD